MVYDVLKGRPPGFWDIFKPKPRKPLHELKWKIPEARLTVPLEEATPVIAVLKKHAKFTGGGEFVDSVHVKEFGENVFGYFFVRTDKKTEEETLLFDGYMLQEDERLGMEVSSGYEMIHDLDKLGYKEEFSREFTLWRFSYLGLQIKVLDISGFGTIMEIALPATKFVKTHELAEKNAFKLLEKLGVDKEQAIPVDVATLELVSVREQKQGKP